MRELAQNLATGGDPQSRTTAFSAGGGTNGIPYTTPTYSGTSFPGPRPTPTPTPPPVAPSTTKRNNNPLSGVGSFITNELLGVDDMRNAVRHAREGDWAGAGRSALAVGAELGGTLAAGASLAATGGADAPALAAIYAGKLAARKGAKEVAKVGAEEAMRLAEKRAAESALKNAGAKGIEKGVVKEETQAGRAAAKEAQQLDKLTSTRADQKFLKQGRKEISKLIGEEPPSGIGRGKAKGGTGEGEFGGPGEGGGTGGSTGGSGARGPIGSEGTGTGAGTGGAGGGGGTATLTRTESRTGLRGGGPEGEPISRPRPPAKVKPEAPKIPGGAGEAVDQEVITNVGADVSKPSMIDKPDAAVPKVNKLTQLGVNTAGALGAGLALNHSTQTGLSTQIQTPTQVPTDVITGDGGGGGGGGGGSTTPPSVDLSGGAGQQDVYLKRFF